MNKKNIFNAPKSTIAGILLILLLGLGLYLGIVTDMTFATLVFTTAVAMLPTNWFREKDKNNLNQD
jgi:uncharacterized membrane protein YphA (DoxX/SURF4 family)